MGDKKSTQQQDALRKSLREMRDRDRREYEERQRFYNQEVARTLREQGGK